MTSIIQRLAFVLFAIPLASCASAPPVTVQPRPEGQGRVEVTMTGFKDAAGQALVALFLTDSNWPDPDESTFATVAAPIRDGQAFAVVENVPAGPFAVSVFHDTDGDRELDSGALGIPSEAYGFSADARSPFGPPKFDEARLELAAGETKQITIRVK
jgi:uncharacterized protein (DUF2141 family)